MSKEVDKGAVSEYHFAAEMLDRGITPCWPSSEGQPYDMIVDTGSNRFKVQVKGSVKTGPSIDFQFMMKQGKKKRRYMKSEVDFIVLHIFEYGSWYIFPIDDVETAVRIKPGNPNCKYRIYLEAWHLITGSK